MKFMFDLAFGSRQRLSRPSLFPGCTSIWGVKYGVQKVVDRNLYPDKDNPFPVPHISQSPSANVGVRHPKEAISSCPMSEVACRAKLNEWKGTFTIQMRTENRHYPMGEEP